MLLIVEPRLTYTTSYLNINGLLVKTFLHGSFTMASYSFSAPTNYQCCLSITKSPPPGQPSLVRRLFADVTVNSIVPHDAAHAACYTTISPTPSAMAWTKRRMASKASLRKRKKTSPPPPPQAQKIPQPPRTRQAPAPMHPPA